MEINNIIQTWYGLATGENVERGDVFFRFIAVWVAFNALYDSVSNESKEFNRVCSFAGIPEVIDRHRKLVAEDQAYLQAIQDLKERGVRDMTSLDRRRIPNVNDLSRVASCLYQVRCNLFHGSKELGNTRDEALVRASYTIVSKLISPFLDLSFLEKYKLQ